jgi:hypothetical protein
MQSELLYSTDQAYIDDTTESVELYDGAFLQMFGRGKGTVDWDGTQGRIEWTNFPPRRPDGVYLPDITGVIKLDGSDKTIMYRMHGISLPPDKQSRRLFAGPVRWYTDNPDYLWLNDHWGYEEGELNLQTLGFTTRAFVLRPEAPQ